MVTFTVTYSVFRRVPTINSVNRLGFVMDGQCVSCEVGTIFVNITEINFRLQNIKARNLWLVGNRAFPCDTSRIEGGAGGPHPAGRLGGQARTASA